MTPYTETDSGGTWPAPTTKVRVARVWPVWLAVLALLGACVYAVVASGGGK